MRPSLSTCTSDFHLTAIGRETFDSWFVLPFSARPDTRALELIKILLRHPEVEITTLTSRSEGNPPVASIHPQLAGRIDLALEDLGAVAVAGRADCAFCCLPHGAAATVIPQLLAAGTRVVDFSADYRLQTPQAYEQWYGNKHADPDRLGKVVYGLPELFREQIRPAKLVANPGCYPTSAILALAPFLHRGLIDPLTIIVDSKSGVSGAGRTLTLTTHYPECNESISAYNVGRHRHTPEIEEVLSIAAKRDVRSHLHSPSGTNGSRHPVDDLFAASRRIGRRTSPRHAARFLRRRAVRARRRPPAGKQGHERYELLRHHRPRRPRQADYDQLLGQPDQRGVRRCRAKFQFDVWISGDHGTVTQPAPSITNVAPQPIGLPQGFRASGVYCGIKRNTSKLDLSLVVSDRPAVAAGVYTRNRVVAASVTLNRSRTPSSVMRAIVINSGNANACTGQRGLDDARQMTRQTAEACGVSPESVLVMSTGVIGHFLPMDKISEGIAAAAKELSTNDDALVAAARGMLTTDTVHKLAGRTLQLGRRTIQITGMAKGAAMIGPNMATMLGVMLTDAPLAAATAQQLLAEAANRSFNCISVDGHMSTNDTVLLLANGAAGGDVLAGAELRSSGSSSKPPLPSWPAQFRSTAKEPPT